MNALEAIPSCSANLIEKPLVGGASLVWNLMESAQNATKDAIKNNRSGSLSHNHGTSPEKSSSDVDESESGEDSLLEDTVVEISQHPPVLSSSITASESIWSPSLSPRDYIEGQRSSGSYQSGLNSHNDSNNPPADSSRILDDLSGMESERKSQTRQEVKEKKEQYDSSKVVSATQRQKKAPEAANNNNDLGKNTGPTAMVYHAGMMPYEMQKNKQCLFNPTKLGSSMTKSRRNQEEERAHKKHLKDHPNQPPVQDIHVNPSHDQVSTMSASQDSFMYQSKREGGKLSYAKINNESHSNHHNNYDYKQQLRQHQTRQGMTPISGTIPENRGITGQAIHPDKSTVLFDSSFQDETRSCMPNLLQLKRRGADGTAASSSSRSIPVRLWSRSGDKTGASEKENDRNDDNEALNPFVYEYETGVNTYVAYFETTSKSPGVPQPVMQVIEHPNPPLLPFGSDEVVVKIEVRHNVLVSCIFSFLLHPDFDLLFVFTGIYRFPI